jgi:hypothetical protein
MTGKIDLLFSDNTYVNCPMDTKSYSRDWPLRRSTNQFCNYAFATGSNYLFVDRVGLQKTIKPEIKHKRVPLSYDPLFLESWRQNTIRKFLEYHESYDTNNWAMSFSSCDKFNRICEYHENVCNVSGEENKIYKLNSFFKTEKPWDVTKPHGKERS